MNGKYADWRPFRTGGVGVLATAVLAAIVWIGLGAAPAASSSCGADGQRACCIAEASFGACQSGVTEVNGCDGDCQCGNSLFSANSHCRQATHCGAEGERACCGGELVGGVACESGLIE